MQPLSTYIHHPELLDADVVKDLQLLVEQYPSFQTARLLMLRGLYQLQDECFGAELRKAAICLPDRRRLFELFEGDVYQPKTASVVEQPVQEVTTEQPSEDRTLSLIDSFLQQRPETPSSRRARPADASVDYTSYLLQLDDAILPDEDDDEPIDSADSNDTSEAIEPVAHVKSSLQKEKTLQIELPSTPSEMDVDEVDEDVDDEHEIEPSEAFFTETLARIYIKQGKYAKAIEIIRRISLLYPQKNRYFADQIRFLEKLLINERNKNNE